ncbi:MAG: hypothetical protein AAF092_05525 [Pseudomonadota bacterium]
MPSQTGNGVVLDSASLSGTDSALDILDWTQGEFSFDTSGSSTDFITLEIDLLSGGYAVLDNLQIAAADSAGEGFSGTGGPAPVPVPAGFVLALSGLSSLLLIRRGQRAQAFGVWGR